MGGDLGGLGDAPKFEMGGRPVHPSPPIFSEVGFVECAQKLEQSKKGVIKELFSEIGVFLVKKGHIRHYMQ